MSKKLNTLLVIGFGLLVGGLMACANGQGAALPEADASVSKEDTKIEQDTIAPPVDNGGLYPCDKPGTICEAHDNCAINPICGTDGICRPQGRRNCDDKLACTIDDCGPLGVCDNKPKPDFCVIPVRTGKGSFEHACFEAGTENPEDPCQLCDPTVNAYKWSPRNGGTCDDGNPCTKKDYCQDGVCKGARYSCDDGYGCTKDVCDGVGGCKHTLEAGKCAIEGTCYDTGASRSYSLKCEVCDPTQSTLDWTLTANSCRIGTTCYSTGDTERNGCGVCTPQQSTTEWSVPSGRCRIHGKCLSDGDTSQGGCGVCDSASSSNAWTPRKGAKVLTYDFEQGLDGITLAAPVDQMGWHLDSERSRHGKSGLYYGDITSRTIFNNKTHNGVATLPKITLPSDEKAALTFWLRADVVSVYSTTLDIDVNGKREWQLTTLPHTELRTWTFVEVPLTKYAGQEVTVTFTAGVTSSYKQVGQGIFVDDISVVTECGKPAQNTPFVMDGRLDANVKQVQGTSSTMPIYATYKNGHLYVATADAGEGNDNFIFVSIAAPNTTADRGAPWDKGGKVAFASKTLFAADENDSSLRRTVRAALGERHRRQAPFAGGQRQPTPGALRHWHKLGQRGRARGFDRVARSVRSGAHGCLRCSRRLRQ
jgi:hypothetical protein